jgi:hypothetical protein
MRPLAAYHSGTAMARTWGRATAQTAAAQTKSCHAEQGRAGQSGAAHCSASAQMGTSGRTEGVVTVAHAAAAEGKRTADGEGWARGTRLPPREGAAVERLGLAASRVLTSTAREYYRTIGPAPLPRGYSLVRPQSTIGLQDLLLCLERLLAFDADHGQPMPAVQCSAVRCSAVRCRAVRCRAVQCGAGQCGAVPSVLLCAKPNPVHHPSCAYRL